MYMIENIFLCGNRNNCYRVMIQNNGATFAIFNYSGKTPEFNKLYVSCSVIR